MIELRSDEKEVQGWSQNKKCLELINELKISLRLIKELKISLALINELALVPVHPLLCREELVSCLSTICQHYQRSITERLGEAKWCSLLCIKVSPNCLEPTFQTQQESNPTPGKSAVVGFVCLYHVLMPWLAKGKKELYLKPIYVYQNIYQKEKIELYWCGVSVNGSTLVQGLGRKVLQRKI